MKRLKTLLSPKTARRETASSPSHVVVGLRNPGADYEGTRHNLGFEVVERLLAARDETLSRGPSRVRALVAQTGVGADRHLLAVPTTFMNDSGSAVVSVLAYFKADVGDLLVIHDDIDLPFGRLRLQVGGGSGGHNGIRSLERSLGTKEFSRLKVGVGRPPGSMDPADFVLRTFSKTERPEADLMVADAADVVDLWVTDRVRAQELAARRGRE